MATREYHEIKKKILFGYLDKYPDAPSNQLAKMLFEKCPEFYKDKEHARAYIRMYRGKYGKDHRKQVKFTKYYQS